MQQKPLLRLARHTAIYGLPTIVGRVLNYLLVPLFTRVFTTGEYGIVTELYAYVAFLFVFLGYGMETAFFRFSTKDDQNRTVFSTITISLLISTIAFLCFAILCADWISLKMGYGSNSEYIKWFALILGFDTLCSIPFAHLRQQGKAVRFAVIRSINIFANIGFNIFFIVICPYLLRSFPGLTIISKIYSSDIGIGYIFISNLIASSLTLLLLLPAFKSFKWKFDVQRWKEMIKYAWPLLILGFAGVVNETADRILLKHLLPADSDIMSQVGIYGACYKISILMTIFIQTYKYAAEPFFFEQMNEKDNKILYARIMNIFVAICAFVFLAIMLNIDLALLLIGKEFRAGSAIIPILLLANLFLGVFYNLSVWFKLTGKTLMGALIAVAGMIITIIFNILLIPSMGYMGAAWATFICYGSMMVISYLVGKKHFPVPYNVLRISGYMLSVVFIYYFSRMIEVENRILGFLINLSLLACYVTGVIYVEKIVSWKRKM